MPTKLIAAGLLLAVCAAPVHAYEVAAVSNGGKIEGKVTYNGAVPIKKIIPTKDKEVCGGPRDEPQILVGPDKGVEDAIVYLKDVAKGKEWGKPDKNPLLDQENCKFRPTVQIIRPGPLDITSSDPVLHNTHGFYGKRTAFNLGLSNKGDKVTRELDKPGMVRVECDAHGWMLAWIYVADSPYYALTKKDGSFSIADVPPGDYAVVATQAHAGDTEAKVSVKPGEAAKVAIELKTK
jgi:nitrous oxide reductase accessory protein NosL